MSCPCAAAIARICSAGSGFNGCGKACRFKASTPDPLAVSAAKASKACVTRTALGMPSVSSVIASWIHHDVHDPQLPIPTIAASHSAAILPDRCGEIAMVAGVS